MRARLLLAAALAAGAAAAGEAQRTFPVTDTGTRFWHVCVVVRDMERMHDFYTRVLGLSQTTELDLADPASVTVHAPTTALANLDRLTGIAGTHVTVRHYSVPGMENFLELLHFPSHPAEPVARALNRPPGWNHLGLEVPDLDAMLATLRAEPDVVIVGGPEQLWGAHRYLIVKDPEGNLVELYEKAKDGAESE
jgi:catechol 2,3-dioxygenase-like lactoylglutathione lyase family enzyme